MSTGPGRTREALALVGAALAFGLAADVLVRVVPARLDVALGLTALLLIGGGLVYRGSVPAPGGVLPLAVPFALLLVALIWRDSPTLFTLNLLGLFLLAALATPALRLRGPARAAVTDYPRGAAQILGASAGGAAALLLGDIDWRGLPEGGPLRRARRAVIGLGAAVPVAALFGGLLMDADPVFRRMLSTTFLAEMDRLASHGATIVFWAWISAGLLRLYLLRNPDSATVSPTGGPRLGLLEVGTVIGVLDLLFLAFVAVQFRYLFGGAELVEQVTGLSYAEYARQGFFQLVTVAALSLPLLLGTDWALGRRDPGSLRRFRLLATMMLLLLNVMLVSALWRMRLYTAEYGLTELRFHTTAFMGWLVLVFGWFAATVLRGRRHRFGAGAVIAAFLVLTTLNLVNPDAVIARINLGRASSPRAVDAAYAARLSADAVPTILRLLPSLPPADRCAVAAALAARWRPELEENRRWTMAFADAARRLQASRSVSRSDCLRPAWR